MKGPQSRASHRPSARYSNLVQFQGAMITDADLTEAGQIHQARDEALGALAFASGVPAQGGMIGWSGGLPLLQSGLVVAGGKVGRFAATGTGMAAFAAQDDLPGGPTALPGGLVLLYADLWERPVAAHEDPYLADPGLQGAQTSLRTRTMVQVKALPLPDAAALAPALAALTAGAFPFLARGTARATLSPRQSELELDPCDPCAEEIEISQTLPNALFRLEILAVSRDGQGRPSALTLAWSLENAEAVEALAALADPTRADAFDRPPAAYEFFNPATEAQIGQLPGALRPAMAGALSPTPAMTPAATPAATHVRRWDGSAQVALGGAVTEAHGTGTVTLAAGKLSLAHEFFTLTLDLTAGAQVQAGDHWLVEIRRYAPEAQRLRLAEDSGLPFGTEHRYCPLFAAQNGVALPPTDAMRRRLTMPPLSDLPAANVAYQPPCPDWYGPVETVKQALDALCNLPASKVAFTPPGVDCDRFAGVTTVQGALEKMCKVEDNSALTLVLRTMMDWGVICGLGLDWDKGGSQVSWTAGVALDRTGRLVQVKAGRADLADAVIQAGTSLAAIQAKEGEVCLSMAFDKEGTVTLHLTDAATVGSDPTYAKAVDACKSRKTGLSIGSLSEDKLSVAEKALLTKVGLVGARSRALKGSVGLDAAEVTTAEAVLERMVKDFADFASPDLTAELTKTLALADKSYPRTGLMGAAAQARDMERIAAKYTTIGHYEQRYWADCDCINLVMPCPPKADDPSLVPLACVHFASTQSGALRIGKLCLTCCRKQALTWRSWRYFGGYDGFANTAHEYGDKCCPPEKTTEPGKFPDWVHEVGTLIPVLPPENLLKPKPWWPPYSFTPPGLDPVRPPFDGGFTDPVRPDIRGPDILGLAPDLARDVLTGNGFQIDQVIDLDTNPKGLDDALTLASANGRRMGDAVRAGDKVVVFAQGGKALGFAPVAEGGRYLYQTTSEAQALDSRIQTAVKDAIKEGGKEGGRGVTLPDTADLADKIADLTAAKDRLGLDIATLGTQRETLAKGLAALEDEVAGLDQRRDGADKGLDRLTTAVKGLEDLRSQIEGNLGGLKTSLDGLDQQRGQIASGLGGLKTDLAGLEQQRSQIAGGIGGMKADLASLGQQRGQISGDLGGMKTDFTALSQLRDQIAQGLTQLRQEALSVDKLRQDTATSLTAIRTEAQDLDTKRLALAQAMSDLQVEQQKTLLLIRGTQPLETLKLPADVTARMKQAGIASIGEVQALPEARLKTILTGSTMDVSKVQDAVTTFLKPR